jgi:hypothetical protein
MVKTEKVIGRLQKKRRPSRSPYVVTNHSGVL